MWRKVCAFCVDCFCCQRPCSDDAGANAADGPDARCDAAQRQPLLSAQAAVSRATPKPPQPFYLLLMWCKALTPHQSCTLCVGAAPTPHAQPRLLQRFEFPKCARDECQWSEERVQLLPTDLNGSRQWFARVWIVDANREVVWTAHSSATDSEPRADRLMLLIHGYRLRRIYARVDSAAAIDNQSL